MMQNQKCASPQCQIKLTTKACPQCGLKYCSERCLHKDWLYKHQFECSERNPQFQQDEYLRIVRSTPFIKQGELKSADAVREEQILAKVRLSDLAIEQKQIGKGSYGTVSLAVHKPSGIRVAVKQIQKASLTSTKIRETLKREIAIQKRLKHQNIVRLYASLEDEKTIYLVLEHVKLGNLFHIIRARDKHVLTEDEAFYFFIQTVAGIYFLHQNGFIHRDLKPENLLVGEQNVLKICDFGWCVQAEQEEARNTFCGTLEYMAPEMITNASHNHQLDVWSLGILLFELCHGKAPFKGDHAKISQEIINGQIKFKHGLSKEYKDLVTKLLHQDPNQRLPLIKIFVHPWVLYFQKKYKIERAESSSDCDSDSSQEELTPEYTKTPLDHSDQGKDDALSQFSECNSQDVMDQLKQMMEERKLTKNLEKSTVLYEFCDNIIANVSQLEAQNIRESTFQEPASPDRHTTPLKTPNKDKQNDLNRSQLVSNPVRLLKNKSNRNSSLQANDSPLKHTREATTEYNEATEYFYHQKFNAFQHCRQPQQMRNHSTAIESNLVQYDNRYRQTPNNTQSSLFDSQAIGSPKHLRLRQSRQSESTDKTPKLTDQSYLQQLFAFFTCLETSQRK